MKWSKPLVIEDGKHKGTILRVESRSYDDYEYTDIIFKLDDVPEAEMKYGCPSNLSPNTKLGRLAMAFGAAFVADEDLDLVKLFAGKRVELMTLKRKSKKDGRDYSEVVEDSIKPLVNEQPIAAK